MRDAAVHVQLRDRWVSGVCRHDRGQDQRRWWADGRSLPLKDALALADRELFETPASLLAAPGGTVGLLTPRQQEVAVLVGQGLTNRQIAERLVISERAAAAHIEHILDRLGVGSRVQIAVWATHNGLLETPSV